MGQKLPSEMHAAFLSTLCQEKNALHCIYNLLSASGCGLCNSLHVLPLALTSAYPAATIAPINFKQPLRFAPLPADPPSRRKAALRCRPPCSLKLTYRTSARAMLASRAKTHPRVCTVVRHVPTAPPRGCFKRRYGAHRSVALGVSSKRNPLPRRVRPARQPHTLHWRVSRRAAPPSSVRQAPSPPSSAPPAAGRTLLPVGSSRPQPPCRPPPPFPACAKQKLRLVAPST